MNLLSLLGIAALLASFHLSQAAPPRPRGRELVPAKDCICAPGSSAKGMVPFGNRVKRQGGGGCGCCGCGGGCGCCGCGGGCGCCGCGGGCGGGCGCCCCKPCCCCQRCCTCCCTRCCTCCQPCCCGCGGGCGCGCCGCGGGRKRRALQNLSIKLAAKKLVDSASVQEVTPVPVPEATPLPTPVISSHETEEEQRQSA